MDVVGEALHRDRVFTDPYTTYRESYSMQAI
jgi:hypothetical protein